MAEAAVFVVGAGASFDFGLPIGTALKQKIADFCNISHRSHTLHGDADWLRLLSVCANMNLESGDVRPYYEASIAIARGMPLSISIDNFLHTRHEDQIVVQTGKIAIVRSILAAENGSKLLPDSSQTLNFNDIENSWITNLFKLLTENCTKEKLSDRLKKVTFVIFNYDRCVEHFLYHALQAYYGIDSLQAAEILENVRFLHPYGTVGTLPWQKGALKVPYGELPEDRHIVEVAEGIKTFTEGLTLPEGDIMEIREAISATPLLIFLGFAYHSQNMELLYAPGEQSTNKSVFGTALYMSNFNVDAIVREMSNKFGHPIRILAHLDCAKLLNEFSRAITFAAL